MNDFDPPRGIVQRTVAAALAEDQSILGDITSLATVGPDVVAAGGVVSRAAGVVAGSLAAAETFRQVDEGLRVDWQLGDGSSVSGGDCIARVSGSLRSILAAERVALNLLTHCSGIATLTRRYVDEVDRVAARTRVRDTRKTTPGLRALEKAAVRAGGGANHRDSLSDAVLIKDNHLVAIEPAAAVRAARDRWPGRIVEIECDTLESVSAVLAAEPDLILVDNMTPDEVAEAVATVAGKVAIEVSGEVTLDTVAAYAATGVEFVAVGALTHSAPILDIGLDL